jgi:hypothetical protein
MDPRRTPQRIGNAHLADKLAYLQRHCRPATPRFRFTSPIQTEAGAMFLGSSSPQNVYLLPQHPNFHLKRCPRPKQICDHPNNEPDKISHLARASPDSRSTTSRIEFAIGTAAERPSGAILEAGTQATIELTRARFRLQRSPTQHVRHRRNGVATKCSDRPCGLH